MYRVEWLESVLGILTEQWIGSDSQQRAAITRATHRIERDLSSDPVEYGESREENRRIHIVMPLVVRYKVEESNRLVTIFHVRVSSRRNT